MKNCLKSKVTKSIFVLSILILSSCKQQAPFTFIESVPQWNQIKVENNQHFIPIAATFGLKGRISPLVSEVPFKRQKESENKLPPMIEYGGVQNLSGYLSILNKRFGDDRLLIDTGDIFSHKLPKVHREKIEQFYDQQKYDVVNFTENEIFHFQKNDFTLPKLQTLKYLSSNIIEIKKNRFLERESIKPFVIKQINDLKVGIIGLTSYSSTNPEIRNKLKGVYFQDPVLSFIKNRNALNKRGVDIIIMINHLESKCTGKSHKIIKMGTDWKNRQLNCPKNDPLKKFIDRLPPNSVHAIISTGTSHTSGFIGNIPILGGYPRGGNIGLMGLFIDKDKKEIIPEKTILFPLIKTCTLHFVGTWDCHIEQSDKKMIGERKELLLKTNYQMTNAKFLGYEVEPKETTEVLNTN
ncbi:MAG: hypothetical protein GY909_05355 [Oligoflexia bacterium]|nr:hypothetical protein [Oligoflexia bacterium]